jgi:ABC-type Mn2+/Zn2+ transport system permease subunit
MHSINPYRLGFLLLVISYLIFILISLNYNILPDVSQNILFTQVIAMGCVLISILLVWRGSIKKINK